MTGTLTLGWAGAAATDRKRSPLETISALAACALLVASTAGTILEQSALSNDPAHAERKSSDKGSSTLPTKETMLGAYTGVPYTYPSPVTIGTEGSGTNFEIDPVHWYTDPFHNPIYYGVRVARWFGGGKVGGMVDFIHSKAIAELGQEANFTGTIDDQTLPERSRVRDVVKKMEFSHGHNMLLFTGLLRLPSIGAHLSPYVGAGGGALLPHTELALTKGQHPRTYEYNFAGPAGQALAGIEIRLARVSIFIEYKFTYGQYEAPLSEKEGSWLGADLWRQFNRWLNDEPPPGGHVTTDIVSHQMVGGLAVRFAPTTP